MVNNPEPQPQDDYSKGVDVVRLISNEFGSTPTVVRTQIALGKIEIGDEAYEGDKFLIPYEQIKGKVISAIGPERQWKMLFEG